MTARTTDGASSRNLIADRMYPQATGGRVAALERRARRSGADPGRQKPPAQTRGTAPPTVGLHAAGEIVLNDQVSPLSPYVGWISLVEGEPGIWAPIGLPQPISLYFNGDFLWFNGEPLTFGGL